MPHLGKLQALVSLLVIVGFFGVLWTLIHTTVAEGMKEVLLVMVGALASKFGDVVMWALKARTDELLANATPPSGGNP
jgi:hypothetical protein